MPFPQGPAPHEHADKQVAEPIFCIAWPGPPSNGARYRCQSSDVLSRLTTEDRLSRGLAAGGAVVPHGVSLVPAFKGKAGKLCALRRSRAEAAAKRVPNFLAGDCRTGSGPARTEKLARKEPRTNPPGAKSPARKQPRSSIGARPGSSREGTPRNGSRSRPRKIAARNPYCGVHLP